MISNRFALEDFLSSKEIEVQYNYMIEYINNERGIGIDALARLHEDAATLAHFLAERSVHSGNGKYFEWLELCLQHNLQSAKFYERINNISYAAWNYQLAAENAIKLAEIIPEREKELSEIALEANLKAHEYYDEIIKHGCKTPIIFSRYGCCCSYIASLLLNLKKDDSETQRKAYYFAKKAIFLFSQGDPSEEKNKQIEAKLHSYILIAISAAELAKAEKNSAITSERLLEAYRAAQYAAYLSRGLKNAELEKMTLEFVAGLAWAISKYYNSVKYKGRECAWLKVAYYGYKRMIDFLNSKLMKMEESNNLPNCETKKQKIKEKLAEHCADAANLANILSKVDSDSTAFWLDRSYEHNLGAAESYEAIDEFHEAAKHFFFAAAAAENKYNLGYSCEGEVLERAGLCRDSIQRIKEKSNSADFVGSIKKIYHNLEKKIYPKTN